MRNDERGDARLVGLERDRNNVAHQAGVVAQVFRKPVGRPFHGGGDGVFGFGGAVGFVLVFAHALYALFHFAHAGQIFIELALVGPTDALGEILGAVFDSIQNADVLQAATVVKQVVPGERWVDFDRDRRIGTLPGEVGTVGQGEVRLVVSGHGLLAGEHDAGLRRVFAHVGGNPLVDADAGVDDGAFRNVRAGQETASLGGMNALAGQRVHVESINDVD